MSEMVERVAREIAIRRLRRVLTKEQIAAGVDERRANRAWPVYVEDARAAIEAMREPTKAMVNAAMAKMWLLDFDATATGDIVRAGHDAMIDAALEPQDAGKVAQRAGA